ncbi:hypothetical protein FVE67_08980 [Thermosulfurimonas marina]|uniref:Uncharacterized protein n=1 Tax=Thermosulfurimonas marina TaxID=2047767 RepID=A0A6H1WUN6_9BACT|nr:hypothetical protein [Thermosulfurimonas marina]QJA06912.1 hypothetical protein FVE67_08980 [Thermosulfurimonas marina]
MFFTAGWIEEALERYRRRSLQDTIMGKKIAFSDRHYLAALLHIYTGTFRLESLACLAGLSLEELLHQRSQVDFMSLVDYLRTRFAEWFREHLLMRDFTLPEYGLLALEYLHLEEQVRAQIRIPLLNQLKHLCEELEDKLAGGKTLAPYDERQLRRLLFFFLSAEALKPSLCGRLVNRTREAAERAYPGEFSRLELPEKEGFAESLYRYLEESLGYVARA